MKKILMIIGIFLINIFALGKINDNLNLFDENQKIEIEKKIEELKDNRDIKVYINSFSGEEGFVVETAEKLIILNFIKEEDRLKIELKLTKDIELEDVREEINGLLNFNEEELKEKQFGKHVVEILNSLNEMLARVKIEEPIVVEEVVTEEKENKFLIGMSVIFFLIFTMIIRILMVKYKKSFKEEMEIVSRKK